MTMLSIEQLYGGYGNETVLSDVSLNIHKGELFGILGPNGSGKTTLLKMISGVLPFKTRHYFAKRTADTNLFSKATC